jgi:hypothetical protein
VDDACVLDFLFHCVLEVQGNCVAEFGTEIFERNAGGLM